MSFAIIPSAPPRRTWLPHNGWIGGRAALPSPDSRMLIGGRARESRRRYGGGRSGRGARASSSGGESRHGASGRLCPASRNTRTSDHRSTAVPRGRWPARMRTPSWCCSAAFSGIRSVRLRQAERRTSRSRRAIVSSRFLPLRRKIIRLISWTSGARPLASASRYGHRLRYFERAPRELRLAELDPERPTVVVQVSDHAT
jgi:hypothetical protein